MRSPESVVIAVELLLAFGESLLEEADETIRRHKAAERRRSRKCRHA